MRSLGRALLVAALLMPSALIAQEAVTSAFEGFSGQGDQPVQVDADRLDVDETKQHATFTGHVVVVQGTSTLRTDKLRIIYDDEAPAAKAATPAAGDRVMTGRNIRRFEAEGNVVVTSGDQKATGDRGVFDMPSNTVVLSSNVVVSQGNNILKGDRLFVDLTKQTSRVESSNSGGRVQGVFGPRPK